MKIYIISKDLSCFNFPATQVYNYLEDAFHAQLRIRLPRDVDFVNIVHNKDPAVSCSLETSSTSSREDNNNNSLNTFDSIGKKNDGTNNGADDDESSADTVVCDLGNPLPAKHLVKLKLKLDASKIGFDPAAFDRLPSRLQFKLEASSKNAEDAATTFDNDKTVSAKVESRVKLTLRGAPVPEQVRLGVMTGGKGTCSLADLLRF